MRGLLFPWAACFLLESINSPPKKSRTRPQMEERSSGGTATWGAHCCWRFLGPVPFPQQYLHAKIYQVASSPLVPTKIGHRAGNKRPQRIPRAHDPLLAPALPASTELQRRNSRSCPPATAIYTQKELLRQKELFYFLGSARGEKYPRASPVRDGYGCPGTSALWGMATGLRG